MALKCIEYIRTYIQVCVILTSINTKDYNTHTHTKKKTRTGNKRGQK